MGGHCVHQCSFCGLVSFVLVGSMFFQKIINGLAILFWRRRAVEKIALL
jgi:hypothetical protein